MSRIDAKGNVRGHDSARDMRHAARHHRHQFRAGQIREEGSDREWRLRLSHENARGHVQRFGSARSHDSRHHPGKNTDDDLHNAEVIKHGKERGDENDGRQHPKGEVAQLRTGVRKIPKDEVRSSIRIAKQLRDRIPGFLKHNPPCVDSEYEYGKHELQAKPPGHGLQSNGTTVC